jgi:hypothetical protein
MPTQSFYGMLGLVSPTSPLNLRENKENPVKSFNHIVYETIHL